MQESLTQIPNASVHRNLAQSKLHLTSSDLAYRPFQRPKQDCPLLSLPPELRLEIYSYLLIESEPVDLNYEIAEDWDPSTGWHALFSTSLQIRDETLPFYHGNNTFKCQCHSLENGGLRPWLSRLHAISPSAIHRIKSITIEIGEYYLPLGQNVVLSSSEGGYYVYPQFDLYDDIIALLSAMGIQASQLVWPGIPISWISRCRDGYGDSAEPRRLHFETNGQDFLQRSLLNDFVIPPLLSRHGLWDGKSLPVEVRRQLAIDQELVNSINGFGSPDSPDASQFLRYVEDRARDLWPDFAPEEWFWAWTASNKKRAKCLEAWLGIEADPPTDADNSRLWGRRCEEGIEGNDVSDPRLHEENARE